jgi:predicted DNA-binding protein with PD1-like motif
VKSKLIHESGEKTFAIIFDKGDEVIAGLQRMAVHHGFRASHFTAIGAFSEVVLGFFDPILKDYRKIHMSEQVEVLSFSGDIALSQDKPRIHAHVVIGRSDGSAHGGHVLAGTVFPTLELILVESPAYLQRRIDDETGLALIDLDAA